MNKANRNGGAALRRATRRDHQERLNRVLLYIQEHLDEPLSLSTLADIACFSPFHFHRIFAAYVGETVKDYVRRTRLELAAHRLCHTSEAVTEIALRAGYETPSAFTKAFRRRFRRSPTGFRSRNTTFRFRRDTLERMNTQPEEATMKPEMRQRKDTKVVCVRRVGPYSQAAGSAWQAVCGFAYPRQLVGKDAEFIGVSHDDPAITAEDKLRYDACITIQREVKPEGEVAVQTIPGGRFAVFTHKGPYSGLHEAYKAIYSQWLPASGAKLRDQSCFEKYLNDPDKTKPENLLTEIFIPVA